MPPPRFSSLPDQVATSMRLEIGKGRWSGTLPGRDVLAKELGVSGKTMEAALKLLQKDGLLESQGAGRRRRIVALENVPSPSLKVAILTFEPLALTEGYIMELQHRLNEAGHSAFFASKSLAELGFDVKKVAPFVRGKKADAWIVVAASREVLEWFAGQPTPAFALFGRRRGLGIAGAGPDKIPAMVDVTRRLVGLGHSRIILLTRQTRRKSPTPGTTEKHFLQELAANGISPSAFNLPDWEETVEGLHRGLAELFRVTPPTALILDEAKFFFAALQFCVNMRLRVPEDVSLVCTDDNPDFAWFSPSVSRIHWDRKPVLRRIEQWVENVSRGKEDIRQNFSKAEFLEGGTMGPVRRE